MVGIKAGGSLLKWAMNRRNRVPNYADTPEGQYLKRVGEQGLYGGQTRQDILSQAGAQTGNVAQERISAMRGMLTNRGFGNSISGLRLLDAPRSERQRKMGDISTDLSIRNEGTKADARYAYASRYNDYLERRRGESRDSNSDLVGGLTDAGMTGYALWQQEKEAEEARKWGAEEGEFEDVATRIELLIALGKIKEAEELLPYLVRRR